MRAPWFTSTRRGSRPGTRGGTNLHGPDRGVYRKLDEWGSDAIVIPHGTTWGFYTPPGSTWDKQLSVAENDPDRQILLEIYSGHGDSDVYREWRAVEFDADGVIVWIIHAPRTTRVPSDVSQPDHLYQLPFFPDEVMG